MPSIFERTRFEPEPKPVESELFESESESETNNEAAAAAAEKCDNCIWNETTISELKKEMTKMKLSFEIELQRLQKKICDLEKKINFDRCRIINEESENCLQEVNGAHANNNNEASDNSFEKNSDDLNVCF